MLRLLLDANPSAAAAVDDAGLVPLHYLVKYQPEAGDMWQILTTAAPLAPSDAGAEASPASATSAGLAAVSEGAGGSVLVSEEGSVVGLVGRVRHVTNVGDTLETRREDRGLILFTSSISAVRATAEACAQVVSMLDALLVNYDQRDVFVNEAYSNQLRRLAGCEGARAPLPSLPRLYLNGKLVGGLDELRELDASGELVATLHAFRHDHQRGRDLDPHGRDCNTCGRRRFVVCHECGGSRRGKTTGKFGAALKCSVCNTAGLVPCPECNSEVAAGVLAGATWSASDGQELCTIAPAGSK